MSSDIMQMESTVIKWFIIVPECSFAAVGSCVRITFTGVPQGSVLRVRLIL